MAVSSRDMREMVDELRALIRSVEDPALAALLRTVFGDRAFFARFKVSPAVHHACVGGLLEHAVAVAATCSHLAEAYPLAARDLLVSAALLHDIGVVEQLQHPVQVVGAENHIHTHPPDLFDHLGKLRHASAESYDHIRIISFKL